ncbi:MAG: hypothetical protein AAGB51_11845 [Planctomycetota bacterium]
MDPILIAALKQVIAPAVGSIVFVLLVWRPRSKDGPPAPAWLASVGLTLAVVVGQFVDPGWHGLWPTDTSRRLLLIAVVAGLVGSTGSYLPGGRATRWGLWGIASAFAVFAVTQHRTRSGAWEGAEAWGWIGAWTLVTFFAVASFEWLARQGPSWRSMLGICLLASAASGLVTGCGIATLGLTMGSFCAFTGFSAAVALVRPGLSYAGGAAGAVGLLYGSCVALSYTSVPEPVPYAGIGAVALAPALLAIGPVARWLGSRRKPALIALGAVLAAAMIVMGFLDMLRIHAQEADEYDPAAEMYGY